MKKYIIVAYADYEGNLPCKEKIIIAKDQDDAASIAWCEFPEYHEVGVFEMEE